MLNNSIEEAVIQEIDDIHLKLDTVEEKLAHLASTELVALVESIRANLDKIEKLTSKE